MASIYVLMVLFGNTSGGSSTGAGRATIVQEFRGEEACKEAGLRAERMGAKMHYTTTAWECTPKN